MRSAGCPMAALASDLPRLSEATREQFAAGVRRFTETIGEKLVALGLADASVLAHSVVSELIGALTLARIELNATRSDAILADSRQLLKQRLNLEARA